MVRSILEYASPEAYCPVWSPGIHYKQGANKVEIVQRQAAGFIMAQCLFQPELLGGKNSPQNSQISPKMLRY